MDIADKIGLLPGFGWIAGHSFIETLIICLVITPFGHIIVGYIGESRLIPVTPDKQFLAFMPGDLFLGVMAAMMLSLAHGLPSEQRWYNSISWHVAVLVVALVTATVMTYMEWKGGVYPSRAIFSPSKLYHNGVLYVAYGYVIVTTIVAVLAGSGWSSSFLLALLPGLVWACLVPLDSTIGAKPALKAAHAHVADWHPLWNRQ